MAESKEERKRREGVQRKVELDEACRQADHPTTAQIRIKTREI